MTQVQLTYQQIYNDYCAKINKASASATLLETYTLEKFLKIIFVNHAPAYPSLLLTPLGFTMLKSLYQTWEIPLAESQGNRDSGKVKVTLHRVMKVPYYLSGASIFVFGSQPALELEMASRDILLWAEMFG